MKKRLFELLTLSCILLLCTSCMGQKQNTPDKIDKTDLKKSSPNESEMFGTKEEMPRFPGCEDQDLNNRELEECAKKTMLAYIYENLEYPVKAKKKGIEGMAVVQFYIDKDGSMIDLKLVRDLEEGCGAAALKTIKKMQSEITWIPGKQFNKLVKVQYTLPIKFKL